jgi:hypothetical protein
MNVKLGNGNGAERRGTQPDRRRSHRLHPAESVGAATGMGGVITGIALHNPLAAALAACGIVPGLVTFVVRHGGLSGVLRLFWRGE